MRLAIRMLMGIGTVIPLVWFSFIIITGNGSNAWASTHISHLSKINVAASTTTTPATSSEPGPGLDSTIIAALIGLGGVALGALIAGGVALYQTRRARQLQKERFQQ